MRTDRRGLLGLAAVAVTGALLPISGCSVGPDDAAVAALVGAWAEAVRRRDRVGLEATMTGASSAGVIATLLAVPFADGGFTIRSCQEANGIALIFLTWRLTGDTGGVDDVLWVPVSRGPGASAVLVVEPPAESQKPTLNPYSPIWWIDDLTAETGDGVTVLRSTSQPRPGAVWLELARTAHREAAEATGRTGSLTVVVPSSPQVLRRVLPLDDAPGDARAAFAWSLGDPDGPIHVFVDPVAAAATGDAELQWLLTHETVHVLTAAPRTALPLWVEEGYADAIAFAADPDAGWQVHRVLTDAVRSGGRPIMTAADTAFGGGSAQALAYATAWSVCLWLTELAGPTGLRRWYDLQTPPGGGVGVVETEAWRTVTRTDPARRESAWRAWLERTAPR